MRMLSIFTLIALFAVTPSHAATVEQAMEQYFQTMQSGDYASAADLFDPEELKSFRESLRFLADLPDASKEQIYGAFFGDGSTQESVNTLSDKEYFASFFAFAMSQAGIAKMMRTAKAEYLGHVMEGDDVAHAEPFSVIQM